MPYTCPHSDCGAVSHHPADLEHGYCGRCHRWRDDPVLIADALVAEMERLDELRRLRELQAILHGAETALVNAPGLRRFA